MESTLASAVETTIATYGTGILRDTDSFRNAILQTCNPHAPGIFVFANNCDATLLAPFVRTVLDSSPSVGALQAAAAEVALLLEERSVDRDEASLAAGQLLVGINRAVSGSQGTVDGREAPGNAAATGETQHAAPGSMYAPATGSEYTTGSEFASAQAPEATPTTTPEAAPSLTSTPTPEAAPTATPDSLAKKRKLRLLIAIGAAVVGIICVALLVVFVVLPRFQTQISFIQQASASGDHEPYRVSGWKGGKIALPEPTETFEGYEFLGWTTTSSFGSDVDRELLDPDSEVDVDDCSTYFGVWAPSVSFDGDGADGGEVPTRHTDENYSLIMPENGFTRPGYTFIGWSDKKQEERESDSIVGTSPGKEVFAYKPTTYYAMWRPSVKVYDATASAKGKLQGELEGWVPASGWAALRVKNDTGSAVNIAGNFVFRAESGNKLGDGFTNADAVAPGATVLLFAGAGSSKADAKSVTYEFEVSDGYSTLSPLEIDKNVQIETVEAQEDRINIKITNTGQKEETIHNVRFVATGEDGSAFVGSNYCNATLSAGESAEVAIVRTDVGDFANVIDLSKLTFTYYPIGVVRN